MRSGSITAKSSEGSNLRKDEKQFDQVVEFLHVCLNAVERFTLFEEAAKPDSSVAHQGYSHAKDIFVSINGDKSGARDHHFFRDETPDPRTKTEAVTVEKGFVIFGRDGEVINGRNTECQVKYVPMCREEVLKALGNTIMSAYRCQEWVEITRYSALAGPCDLGYQRFNVLC